MNNLDFKLEVHEYIDRLFDKSDEYKKILCEIYSQLYKVTMKNNIPCFVTFGTMLGAIRDDCTILPWDMDIDVMIPIKYYEQLLKSLNNDLDSNYYFTCLENTPHYPISEIRICKKGYDSDEFHVDIFYMIGAPENEVIRNKFSKKIYKIIKQRLYKFRDLDQYKNSKIIYILKKSQNLIRGYLPEKLLNIKFKKLLYKYDYDNSSYFAIVSEGSQWFNKSILNESFIKEYDGLSFNILSEYDTFLRKYYGDYTKYLPIENRYKEFFEGIERKNKKINK